MNDKIDSFLKTSYIAEKTKLDTNIIIQKTKLSAEELADLSNSQYHGPIPKKEQICELEIGGQNIAEGKIIKKNGEYYFKIIKIGVRNED